MLKAVLRANGASCAIFGTLFVIAGPLTAGFLGTPPVLLLQLLGLGLLINAAMLIATSLRTLPNRKMILFFSLGDAIWVLATGAILASGLWVTTTGGIIGATIVAMFVGACGLMQWKLLPGQT